MLAKCRVFVRLTGDHNFVFEISRTSTPIEAAEEGKDGKEQEEKQRVAL